MYVIPAIDIKDGKCVRLTKGEFSQVEVFSENPVKVAREFMGAGAKLIHVVDLDGARTGKLVNFNVVKQIGEVAPIEVGGGIRSLEDAKKVMGIYEDTKVVFGTAVIKNREILEKLQERKRQVVVGIDARGEKVALEGWVEKTEVDAYELAKEVAPLCSRIIFTAIERDGAMIGPDLEAIRKMVEAVDVPVTASGGVTELEDVEKIRGTGAHSVIIGKAIYKKQFTVQEAIKAAGQE